MHMQISELELMERMVGLNDYERPKTLVLNKQELVTLKRAKTICDKAVTLLGSDDEYEPDDNCPFRLAASWLYEITGE
jgi:hypothetical protein